MSEQAHVIEDIVTEVANERWAQIEKWGVQDWPSLFNENFRREFAGKATYWKAVNDAREAAGISTWDGILLEEVFEALAERSEVAMRAELVQVAAVAVAWIEAIDRRLKPTEAEVLPLPVVADDDEAA